MAQVFVKYNPYKMETQISINGKAITTDSGLYKVIRGKRLQEWVAKFPQMLVDELNTVDFDMRATILELMRKGEAFDDDDDFGDDEDDRSL